MDTLTKTQTTTITGGDVRKCAQYTVDDAAMAYEAYGFVFSLGKPRLARDIGLMYLGEWVEEIQLELYDPKTMKAHGRHIYRPKADAKARHHEPGSFRKLNVPKGLSIRIVAMRNPTKPKEECDAFFNEIGWLPVPPTVDGGRGRLERDGGFRSGGFHVERWVYFDGDDSDGQKGGYLS